MQFVQHRFRKLERAYPPTIYAGIRPSRSSIKHEEVAGQYPHHVIVQEGRPALIDATGLDAPLEEARNLLTKNEVV